MNGDDVESPFDISFFCSRTQNLIDILEKIGDDCVKDTGFFHSGPELHCNRLHPHPK